MPMMTKTEFGMVVAIWGQAWIRDANGHFRPLKVGDAVHRGAVVLTQQDSIVQLAQTDAPRVQQSQTKKAAESTEADRVIEALNQGDAKTAPAAGLTGGEGGDLTPGFRVERIVELTTPAGQLRSSGLDALLNEPLRSGATAPEPTLGASTLAPLVVNATEEGPNVGIGLQAPDGATQIRIDAVPTSGQVLLADGTLVGTGKLRPRESMAQGLEAAPEAFLGMLKGRNFGKQLVKLV